MLPSEPVLEKLVKSVDFKIADHKRMGDSYARTVSIWRKQFFAKIQTVRDQGFDERFERMWDYYLSYCEAGFNLETINVSQIILNKNL